jgi:hypothetical protein
VAVAVAPGYRLGAFEVKLGDDVVYSKLKTGTLPTVATLVEQVLHRIRNP